MASLADGSPVTSRPRPRCRAVSQVSPGLPTRLVTRPVLRAGLGRGCPAGRRGDRRPGRRECRITAGTVGRAKPWPGRAAARSTPTRIPARGRRWSGGRCRWLRLDGRRLGGPTGCCASRAATASRGYGQQGAAAVPDSGTEVTAAAREVAEARWLTLAEAVSLMPDMHEPVRAYLPRTDVG